MSTERTVERDVEGIQLATDGWMSMLDIAPNGTIRHPATSGPETSIERFCSSLGTSTAVDWLSDRFDEKLVSEYLDFLEYVVPHYSVPQSPGLASRMAGYRDVTSALPLLLNEASVLARLEAYSTPMLPPRRAVRRPPAGRPVHAPSRGSGAVRAAPGHSPRLSEIRSEMVMLREQAEDRASALPLDGAPAMPTRRLSDGLEPGAGSWPVDETGGGDALQMNEWAGFDDPGVALDAVWDLLLPPDGRQSSRSVYSGVLSQAHPLLVTPATERADRVGFDLGTPHRSRTSRERTPRSAALHPGMSVRPRGRARLRTVEEIAAETSKVAGSWTAPRAVSPGARLEAETRAASRALDTSDFDQGSDAIGHQDWLEHATLGEDVAFAPVVVPDHVPDISTVLSETHVERLSGEEEGFESSASEQGRGAGPAPAARLAVAFARAGESLGDVDASRVTVSDVVAAETSFGPLRRLVDPSERSLGGWARSILPGAFPVLQEAESESSELDLREDVPRRAPTVRPITKTTRGAESPAAKSDGFPESLSRPDAGAAVPISRLEQAARSAPSAASRPAPQPAPAASRTAAPVESRRRDGHEAPSRDVSPVTADLPVALSMRLEDVSLDEMVPGVTGEALLPEAYHVGVSVTDGAWADTPTLHRALTGTGEGFFVPGRGEPQRAGMSAPAGAPSLLGPPSYGLESRENERWPFSVDALFGSGSVELGEEMPGEPVRYSSPSSSAFDMRSQPLLQQPGSDADGPLGPEVHEKTANETGTLISRDAGAPTSMPRALAADRASADVPIVMPRFAPSQTVTAFRGERSDGGAGGPTARPEIGRRLGSGLPDVVADTAADVRAAPTEAGGASRAPVAIDQGVAGLSGPTSLWSQLLENVATGDVPSSLSATVLSTMMHGDVRGEATRGLVPRARGLDAMAVTPFSSEDLASGILWAEQMPVLAPSSDVEPGEDEGARAREPDTSVVRDPTGARADGGEASGQEAGSSAEGPTTRPLELLIDRLHSPMSSVASMPADSIIRMVSDGVLQRVPATVGTAAPGQPGAVRVSPFEAMSGAPVGAPVGTVLRALEGKDAEPALSTETRPLGTEPGAGTARGAVSEPAAMTSPDDGRSSGAGGVMKEPSGLEREIPASLERTTSEDPAAVPGTVAYLPIFGAGDDVFLVHPISLDVRTWRSPQVGAGSPQRFDFLSMPTLAQPYVADEIDGTGSAPEPGGVPGARRSRVSESMGRPMVSARAGGRSPASRPRVAEFAPIFARPAADRDFIGRRALRPGDGGTRMTSRDGARTLKATGASSDELMTPFVSGYEGVPAPYFDGSAYVLSGDAAAGAHPYEEAVELVSVAASGIPEWGGVSPTYLVSPHTVETTDDVFDAGTPMTVPTRGPARRRSDVVPREEAQWLPWMSSLTGAPVPTRWIEGPRQTSGPAAGRFAVNFGLDDAGAPFMPILAQPEPGDGEDVTPTPYYGLATGAPLETYVARNSGQQDGLELDMAPGGYPDLAAQVRSGAIPSFDYREPLMVLAEAQGMATDDLAGDQVWREGLLPRGGVGPLGQPVPAVRLPSVSSSPSLPAGERPILVRGMDMLIAGPWGAPSGVEEGEDWRDGRGLAGSRLPGVGRVRADSALLPELGRERTDSVLSGAMPGSRADAFSWTVADPGPGEVVASVERLARGFGWLAPSVGGGDDSVAGPAVLSSVLKGGKGADLGQVYDWEEPLSVKVFPGSRGGTESGRPESHVGSPASADVSMMRPQTLAGTKRSAAPPSRPDTWSGLSKAFESLSETLRSKTGAPVMPAGPSSSLGPIELSLLSAEPVRRDTSGVAEGVYMESETPSAPSVVQPSGEEEKSGEKPEVWGMEEVVAELRWRMKLQDRWDNETE